MKTITIEHKVSSYHIYCENKNKITICVWDNQKRFITEEHFKTFDEVVKYVRDNLL